MTNKDIKSRIYGRICASTPNAIWGGGDFTDFGPRDAVDKALQRLAAAGKIRRVDRGLYDRPHTNLLTGKPAAADYRAVIDAVARRDRTRVLVDGMTAANDLGLSNAVPGRIVVHSDGRLKTIHLGKQTIRFRPTSASKLYWAGRPAMRIVQALHWLKPKLNNPDDARQISQRIAGLLSDKTLGQVLRKDLLDGFSSLPTWMQSFLQSVLVAPTPHKSKRKKTEQLKASAI